MSCNCKGNIMIRNFEKNDLNDVMRIWLNGNIDAHAFINSEYWKDNYDLVKEMIPKAEIYVHTDDATKKTDGFIGLTDSYIEGIFVEESARSKGIGKQLLDYVKTVKSGLGLSVYEKNERAISFYLRERFLIQSENIDDNTGEKELVMVWNKQTDSEL